MDTGRVWGHDAYLGPDFSAQQRPPSLDPAARIAPQRFANRYAEISTENQAAVETVTAARPKRTATIRPAKS
jgi:nitric oxide reductase large subunit